jgi:ABC-2 type transport system ATP-binding protein
MNGQAPRPAPAIEVDDVWVSGPDGRRICGLSLRVDRGEVAALVGPAGSGKGLVVEMLMGWRRPDQGVVEIFGREPWEAGRQLAYEVGALLKPQGNSASLHDKEDILYFAGLFRTDQPPRFVYELMEELQLDGRAGDPSVRTSLGHQRLLALGRALAAGPPVLVLEEPMLGLDYPTRVLMRCTISQLAMNGKTVFLTGSDPSLVGDCADRVLVFTPEARESAGEGEPRAAA